jgi:hypothetical protein
MRPIGVLAAAAWLVSVPASAAVSRLLHPAPAEALREVADRMQAQVVQLRARATVVVRNGDGEVVPREASLSGAGVLIGNGLALASLHLAVLPAASGGLESVDRIDVAVPGRGIHAARLLGGDVALDVGVFQLAGIDDLEGASLAGMDPAVGDALVAMGTEGDHIDAAGSQIAAVQSLGGVPFRLLLEAQLTPEFWGGPLFDADGKLAGLLAPAEAGSVAAVPVSLVRRVIENALQGEPAAQ